MLQSVLEGDFDVLPPALRTFHSGTAGRYTGTVRVRQGNWLARCMCLLGGFPRASSTQPMRMSIALTSDGEEWHRDFRGHVLKSVVRRSGKGQVSERFGIFDVKMRPSATERGLEMPVTGISVFGIPVPRKVVARSGGSESVTEDGKIQFRVTSELFGIGRLIAYEGMLEPANS